VRTRLALTAVLALAAMSTSSPTARAATLPRDGIVQSIPAATQLAHTKYKAWKVKKVKRGGPPPWAPAHGLRRKRGW
jgi:hypothetical protein